MLRNEIEDFVLEGRRKDGITSLYKTSFCGPKNGVHLTKLEIREEKTSFKTARQKNAEEDKDR
jgi:hypothetical protein